MVNSNNSEQYTNKNYVNMLKIIFVQKVLAILACGGFSFAKSIILLRGSAWWLVFIAASGFGNIFGKVRVSRTSALCSPRSPVRIPDSCMMGRMWKCTLGWIDEEALRPWEGAAGGCRNSLYC